MKPALIFTLLFIGINLTQGQTDANALNYLNELTDGQKEISVQLMRYISVSAHSQNAQTIALKRENLIEATKKMRNKAIQAQGYNKDSSLKQAMVSYYSLCLKTLTSDYKNIAALKQNAKSSYEIMKRLLESEETARDNIDKAHRRLDDELEQFANTYQITLIEKKNPLSEMIAKSNEVATYYNSVFLPMFKVNLQNVHLKEMLATKNIEKIEQARKLAEQYAIEAKNQLNKIDAFYGDNQLLTAALKRINYYVKETNTMGLNTISFIQLQQKLQAQKSKLEAVSAKDRTKEMVDNYNALVKEANATSQQLNMYAQQFNELGALEMAQWKKIVKQFRKRHTPKFGLLEQST